MPALSSSPVVDAPPAIRREPHWLRAAILLLAVTATLTGARSFTAVAEWAADAPVSVLARLGLSRGAPSEKTIRRVLQLLDADALDTALGAWMWLRARTIGGATVISFDGKTLRGARGAAGNLPHLLAGICQATGVIVARIAVGTKTSEVPMLRKLLSSSQIAGCVITADAAHTCRETAQLIVDAGAHYVLPVKADQPLLRARCKALPWRDIPLLDRSSGPRRHGRLETRTPQATEIDHGRGIGFPGAVQILRVTRIRTLVSRHRDTRKQTRETVYVVTSLAVTDADHQQIAEYLRGHWMIENSAHHVRDVTFDEDRSQIRTGAGPQVMASLRNTALNLLKLTGHTDIAPALRYHARDFNRPTELVLNC